MRNAHARKLDIARLKLATFLRTLSVNELALLRDYHDGAVFRADIRDALEDRGVDPLIDPEF